MLGEGETETRNGCERRAKLVRYDGNEVALQPLGFLESFDRRALAVEELRVLHRRRDRRNEHENARAHLLRKRVDLWRVDLDDADGPAVHDEWDAEIAPHVWAHALPHPE